MSQIIIDESCHELDLQLVRENGFLKQSLEEEEEMKVWENKSWDEKEKIMDQIAEVFKSFFQKLHEENMSEFFKES